MVESGVVLRKEPLMGRHADNDTAAGSYHPNQLAHRARIIRYMLEDVRGDGYVEYSRTEWELDPVGTAVRRSSSALRDPNRKRVRLYANDRAERSIGHGVPAGAAPVVENAKGTGSTPGDLFHKSLEQAAVAAEPPMAQLHLLHRLVLG
jgi:hypothetical protein